MVVIAPVKSKFTKKGCLLSNVEHNSLLFSRAFIFIPYLNTLLLTCIIKVDPLSVTEVWACMYICFSSIQVCLHIYPHNQCLCFSEPVSHKWDAVLMQRIWHEGFPSCALHPSTSRGWSLISQRLTGTSSAKFSKNLDKCNFVMQKCHHPQAHWEGYCSDFSPLMFRRICWCFSPLMEEVDRLCFRCLCPAVSVAGTTKQTNIFVSAASRNLDCGIFQSMLLERLGTCMWWFMDWRLWV